MLATAALVFPYARRRVERFGDYKLLAGWIWPGVILLSLFPEKKERYLLPVLLPLAILTALLVRALVQAFRDATATRGDTGGARDPRLARDPGRSAAAPIALWAMVRQERPRAGPVRHRREPGGVLAAGGGAGPRHPPDPAARGLGRLGDPGGGDLPDRGRPGAADSSRGTAPSGPTTSSAIGPS